MSRRSFFWLVSSLLAWLSGPRPRRSHLYDWKNGCTDDPRFFLEPRELASFPGQQPTWWLPGVCRADLPMGGRAVHRVYLDGKDVTERYIFELRTGPTGHIKESFKQDGLWVSGPDGELVVGTTLGVVEYLVLADPVDYARVCELEQER